ncbi:hypothetical protein C8J57DRAFT_34512 [Mycena rebaudengoi]|nr:hypothetical protein C8J57DRAFT_34512 [Mycena rebaudengoi]
MPKSAKKRKDKAADFSKARLKLGKGKQLASNAIDTSFKARSIALPSQSITSNKDDSTPTTKRRLTFDDLIVHLKHYNAGTRKDAIAGLRELLDAHPHLLESSLTTLINGAVRTLGDEDAAVRKSLLEFFAWLFPRIPIDNLVPHSTALLLFTTSAQTHIFPEIRVDAIRFLNLFLEYIPAATVAGWNKGDTENGSRVLEGYLGILSAGTKFGETDGPMKATSTASVVLTSASKLVVLQSLSTFLRHAVSSRASRGRLESPSSSSIDTWYLASWFQSIDAYDVFDHLLQPRHSRSDMDRYRTWQAQISDMDLEDSPPYKYLLLDSSFGSGWTLQHLSDIEGASGSSVDGDAAFVTHLARTLHSTLISTFLDCAPSVFSPNGNVDEVQAKLIVAVAEITRHLYGAILQSASEVSTQRAEASADLRSILGYMAPYFPFKINGARDIKAEQAFQALNLIFCELTSLLILTSDTVPIRRGKQRVNQGQEGLKDSLQVQTERVSEYVVQLLRGESLSTSQLGRPITSTAYAALLPTIWSLINNSNPSLHHLSSDVLQATVEHASKVSSKSALKQVTTEFVARIVLLDTEPQFNGNLKIGRSTAETAKVTEWLDHLPKCLWELGSTNLATTEIILRFLILVFRRRSRLANIQATASLRSQIIPYFSITHAVRGQVAGPYYKIPATSPIRRLALDLVAIMGDAPSLVSAVDAAVSGTAEESYWRNIKAP